LEKKLYSSKIINDPVHGFIEIPRGLIMKLIDHPAFQRLRRIKQLGMSSLVYPGAMHTRFNHALGAMHLMKQALDVLRNKGVSISDEEYQAALIAILLHDIGHGPFSHALEYSIIKGLHHEDMSIALMHYFNRLFDGQLSLTIEIFENKYPRIFFHQLVSSQLDMDRMDYLIRDSFFTGVAEGIVGIDRIIKTLNVYQDKLVVESKGIYSVEKFIIARRLMYWQVYLHKASVSSEVMIVNILKRVRELIQSGQSVYLDKELQFFLENPIDSKNLSDEVIEHFIRLDDINIQFAMKQWQYDEDRILSELCNSILNRRLFKTKLQSIPFDQAIVEDYTEFFCKQTGYSREEAKYFVFTGKVSNQAYLHGGNEPITIYFKNGHLEDLTQASDIQNMEALSRSVIKHYLTHPAF